MSTATRENHARTCNKRKSQTSEPGRKYWFHQPGSRVEVNTKEEKDFENAWLSGTVIAPPSSAKDPSDQTVFVKYDNLIDDDTGRRLVEAIKLRYIRPMPDPDEGVSVFEVNDVVDAFYNDVWWSGYVGRVLVDQEYTVVFHSPVDVLQLQRSVLRAHLDWLPDFGWVAAPKQQPIAGSLFLPATAIEIDLDVGNPGFTWTPGSYICKNVRGMHVVKHVNRNDDAKDVFVRQEVYARQIRPRPPSVEIEDYELLQKVDAPYNSNWVVGVIIEILVKKHYTVSFEHLGEKVKFSGTLLRPHVEQRASKSKLASRSKGSKTRSNKTSAKYRVEPQMGNGETIDEKVHEQIMDYYHMFDVVDIDVRESNT